MNSTQHNQSNSSSDGQTIFGTTYNSAACAASAATVCAGLYGWRWDIKLSVDRTRKSCDEALDFIKTTRRHDAMIKYFPAYLNQCEADVELCVSSRPMSAPPSLTRYYRMKFTLHGHRVNAEERNRFYALVSPRSKPNSKLYQDTWSIAQGLKAIEKDIKVRYHVGLD